jgi:hypothetical protein
LIVLNISDIVKQFAEAMGGGAFVKSKGIGYGSSFYFCVPHQIDCPLHSSPTFITGAPCIPQFLTKTISNENGKKRILFADVR